MMRRAAARVNRANPVAASFLRVARRHSGGAGGAAASSSRATLMAGVAGGLAAAAATVYATDGFTATPAGPFGGPRVVVRNDASLPRLAVEGHDEFAFIVAGGGPGGCTAAYCLATWLEELDLPGRVLLVDCGDGLEKSDLRLEAWETEWGSKSLIYEQQIITDNATGATQPHPVYPTEHRGIGGASAHNTAIPFALDEGERSRWAARHGIDKARLDACHQAAVLLEPVMPATAANKWWQSFFAAVAPKGAALSRVKDDFLGIVGADNTIGYFAVAGWPRPGDAKSKAELKALRYTPALLTESPPNKADQAAPSRLTVLKNSAVRRIALEATGDLPAAIGVVVKPEGSEQEMLIAVSHETGGQVISGLGPLTAPALLQWSGVGDAAHLAKVGVHCRVPNKHVGADGYDHTETSVIHEIGPNKLAGFAEPSLGTMGWDVGVFRRLPTTGAFVQCHASFGGFPYVESGEKVLVTTPNITDPTTALSVKIKSADPKDSFDIIQEPFSDYDKAVVMEAVHDIIDMWKPAQETGLLGKLISPEDPANLTFDDLRLETPFHWHNTLSTGRVVAADGLVKTESGARLPNLRAVGAATMKAQRNMHMPVMGGAVHTSLSAIEAYAGANGRSAHPEPVMIRNARAAVARQKNKVGVSDELLVKASSAAGFATVVPGGERPQRQATAEAFQAIYEAEQMAKPQAE